MRNNITKRMAKGRKLHWGRLILIAVLLVSAWKMYGRIEQYLDLKHEVALCQAALDVVQAEYDSKVETIELLSDDAYIERLARENLGMVIKGETPVSSVKVNLSEDTGSSSVMDDATVGQPSDDVDSSTNPQ